MPQSPATYDVIIFGGGIAGLWLGNVLHRAGYNIIVIEKDKLGAGQTLASQGMIHGGQKYTLEGAVTAHAANIAKMPARWEACLGGWGDVDLTAVKTLSDRQIMWPAGSLLSDIAVFGAAKLVNAATRKMKRDEFPAALSARKKFKGPVYELPERVMDTRSLVQALAAPLKGRLFQGAFTELLPDGQVAVSGQAMQAQALVFAAGTGNEDVFRLLNIQKQYTQRRPLRQIMVRHLPDALYGHGIVGHPKPRLTVTSYADGHNGYIWYIGGNIAEKSAAMTEDDALAFARAELAEVFPDTDWAAKEWATWHGDRAEPFDEKGDLQPGPFVHQRGRILVAWPSKLTFAPMLADTVMAWIRARGIAPECTTPPPSHLMAADIGSHPWEVATWRTL